MYKLLIADDESIIRKGIKNLIDFESLEIDQVFEAENGKEAVDLALKNKIDIVIMDINMPIIDGLSASKKIKEKNPDSYLLILTGYNYFDYAQAAIRAKVDDYILKPVSKKDVEYMLKTAVNKLNINRKNESLKEYNDENLKAKESYEDIKKYIDKNVFCEDFSLNKMASDIGYNNNYLSSLIKEIYGLSFQDLSNKLRMEKARILLLTSDMKNQEIADAVGIYDVSYFSNKFKKYFGKSPK
ncbi:MAG: response regulator, partial [Anaerococcus sp.]